jgi:hypothetical protein
MVSHRAKFIQQEQQCKLISFSNLLTNFVYSNDQTFHVIFASSMRQDYSVYPSMIGAQSGLIWSYDNSTTVFPFSDDNPLNISHCICSEASMCLWYVSPIIELSGSNKISYALLGELNKWTAVSQQRIISIDNQKINHIAIITVRGAPDETVSMVIFHSTLQSVTVNCRVPADVGNARIIITTSSVICA